MFKILSLLSLRQSQSPVNENSASKTAEMRVCPVLSPLPSHQLQPSLPHLGNSSNFPTAACHQALGSGTHARCHRSLPQEPVVLPAGTLARTPLRCRITHRQSAPHGPERLQTVSQGPFPALCSKRALSRGIGDSCLRDACQQATRFLSSCVKLASKHGCALCALACITHTRPCTRYSRSP